MKTLLTATAIAVIGLSASAALAGDHGHDYGDKAKKTMEMKAKAETGAMADATTPDIVGVALGNEDFSTLVAALQAGELVEALQAEGPFTVFAPTNDAFAALPEGTLEDLLKPENKEQLQTILKYHVVAAEVPSSAAAGNQVSLDTLAGQALAVDGTEGVKVNNATVTAADIEASNGVIHVIDTVLIPE